MECFPGRFERHAHELAAIALYSRDCLNELREHTGIEYERSGRGILHFCTDERDFEALARHAESMRRLGVVREAKSAAECVALEPALREARTPIVGGVYSPEDESGDAHVFTQKLAGLARGRGVQFRWGSGIEAIEAEGDRAVRVRIHGAQAMEVDAYVVSLGAYSPMLLAPLGIRIPVYPLKGYSVTIPLDAEQIPAAPAVSLTDEAAKIVVSRSTTIASRPTSACCSAACVIISAGKPKTSAPP